MFSSKSFTVLALRFRLLLFVFLYMVWGIGVQLHLFCMWVFSFLAPFVEKIVLSPSISLDPLVKSQLAINAWIYLWTLNSIPLVYMSILMLVPHCFDHCSFVVSFEIGNCEFFFKNVLAFWVPTSILGSAFQFLQRNPAGIWIGIGLNL